MVKIYVEGGGDQAALKTKCRRAFRNLLEKAGFQGKMPSIYAEGSRGDAFDAFKTAMNHLDEKDFVVLLVDSETVPEGKDPWSHLKSQGQWDKPDRATGDQAQLMVVCMETWLLADLDAFEKYFGKDFKKNKLPTTDLENRSKQDVYNAIATATAITKPKGKYGKARDSFELLGQMDPKKLIKSCAWAKRFFAMLNKLPAHRFT